jgi:hypothetical protein
VDAWQRAVHDRLGDATPGRRSLGASFIGDILPAIGRQPKTAIVFASVARRLPGLTFAAATFTTTLVVELAVVVGEQPHRWARADVVQGLHADLTPSAPPTAVRSTGPEPAAGRRHPELHACSSDLGGPGSAISGNITKIVVIKTDTGSREPRDGTGTYVATYAASPSVEGALRRSPTIAPRSARCCRVPRGRISAAAESAHLRVRDRRNIRPSPCGSS